MSIQQRLGLMTYARSLACRCYRYSGVLTLIARAEAGSLSTQHVGEQYQTVSDSIRQRLLAGFERSPCREFQTHFYQSKPTHPFELNLARRPFKWREECGPVTPLQ